MNTEKLSNEAENPALNKGAVSSSTYYGTLSINDRLLTVVKVIDGSILEKRMIQISFWKSFLELQKCFSFYEPFSKLLL